MKTIKLIALTGVLLTTACASNPQRIPSVQEATAGGTDLESGIYNRKNGENVSVEVTSLREKVSNLEQQLADSKRESNYYKDQNQQLQTENQLLRVKGNYKLEKNRESATGIRSKRKAHHSAAENERRTRGSPRITRTRLHSITSEAA